MHESRREGSFFFFISEAVTAAVTVACWWERWGAVMVAQEVTGSRLSMVVTAVIVESATVTKATEAVVSAGMIAETAFIESN